MFTGRLRDSTIKDFNRAEAAQLIPKSTPFLRGLFDYIAGINIDERIIWVVDSLAEIFVHTDVADIMKSLGEEGSIKDPVLHFYETFLSKFDADARRKSGSFYTPQPIVDFIVRSLDALLISDFNLPLGLADYSRLSKKGAEFHRVQILDPACGTGTFLAQTILRIHSKFANNQGAWSAYAAEDLLPRVHGFELLMASYALAHLKLDIVLRSTGYLQDEAPINKKLFQRVDLFDERYEEIRGNAIVKNTKRRLSVYLTNSLEEADVNAPALFGAEWLTDEAHEANIIKNDLPIMCIIGNPPYRSESSNKSRFINELISVYKREADGGKLKERNIKPINDDYVKFIRLAEYYIEKNGSGVLAFINNNAYLDNPTFRGMRYKLLTCFDKIYIINLHGRSMWGKELTPDGVEDKNVFDIQVGVAINIFVKTGEKPEGSLAELKYTDLYSDKRKVKFDWLNEHELDNIPFRDIKPTAPYYFMIPKDYTLQEEYNRGFNLQELFKLNSVGIVTGRDSLAIQFTEGEMLNTLNDFASLSIEAARARYNLGKDTRDWSVAGAQRDIISSVIDPNRIVKIAYRPFDLRVTYWTGNSKGFQCMARARAMEHIVWKDNLVLLSERIISSKGYDWTEVNVADKIYDKHMLGSACYGFPLYVYGGINGREPNLDGAIVDKLEEIIGFPPLPEDIFYYIYALLHNPSYIKRFAEFLKTDFPRIAYPKDSADFSQNVLIGKKLVELHLLRVDLQSSITFSGDGDCIVRYVKRGDKERVYINDTQFFTNVTDDMWEFKVGGYQAAEKYLKDRKNRTLTLVEINHYRKVLAVLSETRLIMGGLSYNPVLQFN
jgi:predicted helicase